MAEDSTHINDVASNSVSILVSAVGSLLTGAIIAFVFCWQMAVACMILIPIAVYSQIKEIKLTYERVKMNSDLTKEASLLLGDTICNFRTVQSFGNEHMLI